jgi:hypothetical protein
MTDDDGSISRRDFLERADGASLGVACDVDLVVLGKASAALRAGMLALMLGTSACSTWHVRTAPVREVAAAPVPRARVTLRDGARMQLWNAHVEGDSLVGHLTDDTAHTAFAVADVATVETWEPDTVQTVKMTVIVVLGVAYSLFQLAIATSSP